MRLEEMFFASWTNADSVELHRKCGCPCSPGNPRCEESKKKWKCVCSDEPNKGGILMPAMQCSWRPLWLIQAEAYFGYPEPASVTAWKLGLMR